MDLTPTVYPKTVLRTTTVKRNLACEASDLGWQAGFFPKTVIFQGDKGSVEFYQGHKEIQFGDLQFVEYYNPQLQIRIMIFND